MHDVALQRRKFSFQWGPYFQPDADDDQKLVKVAADAKDKGVATLRMAVEKIAPVFGIEDVDATLAEIEKESEERESKEIEREEAKAHALGKAAVASAVGVGNSGGAGKDPKKAAPVGGGKPTANAPKGPPGNARNDQPKRRR